MGFVIKRSEMMTKRIGNILIICNEEPGICQVCGTFAELRPYGINGEQICPDCGKKNKKETVKQMYRALFDEEATDHDVEVVFPKEP